MLKLFARKKISRLKILESRGQLAIIILALIVISAVYYAAYQNRLPHRTAQAINNPQAEISITGNGFVPQILTIKAGTQVTWVNNDISPHEIAGDPYPTDDSIPGLKNTGVLHIGDSYIFTFLIPDNYGYHDDLNPEIKGSVVVQAR